MGETVIEFKNVSKQFDVRGITKYGGTAKQSIKKVFDNLTFSIGSGEVVGIIGHNGAGKSVLLKLLSRIIYPDSGTISCKKSITSILELGIGFDSELSGRENIAIKCSYYGLSQSEIDRYMEKIIEFSEIGEQVDYPIRTYSSGMKAKLAFSIIMYVKSDIMILDEVLSVGDAGFHEKCKQIFSKMKKENKTIIIASHNLDSLNNLCDKVLWIDHGHVKEYGDATAVITHYNMEMKYSLSLIKEMADSGDVLYQTKLGTMYQYGINVEKNLEEAKNYFIRASNMGYAEAKLNLAELYYANGECERAQEIYRVLADQGNSVAVNKLEFMKKDEEIVQLIKELEFLSDRGNLRATKMLADIYIGGDIVPKNPTRGLFYCEKCAKTGNIQAQQMAAWCYLEGIGVEKNIDLAVQYYMMAANNGNRKSMADLGNLYYKGIGVTRDLDRAIFWFEKAAKMGDIKAISELVKIYRDEKKEELLSRQWETKNAENQLSFYEVSLADVYRQGYVGDEQRMCMPWYLKACAKDNVSAIYSLSQCYYDDLLTPMDLHKSFELLKRLEDCNNPNILYDLGLRYYKGEGTAKDDNRAFQLIKKAACMGHVKSMVQLVQFYRWGVGTETSKESLLTELKKLIEMGNPQGRKIYYELMAEQP